MSFNAELKEDLQLILDSASRAVEDAIIDTYDFAVDATPVDTGEAKSFWQISTSRKAALSLREQAPPLGHTKGNDVFSAQFSKTLTASMSAAKSFNIQKDSSIQLTNTISFLENNRVLKSLEMNVTARLDQLLKHKLGAL